MLGLVCLGCVLSFNNNLYKQTDGCGMGNPLSPVLANIFMCKPETDIIAPANSPLLITNVLMNVSQNSKPIHLTNFNSH